MDSVILPQPLVPPDTDIGGMDGFLLRTDKLMASELWAISTGDEFKAAMGLWARAWSQSPAGSLPDDERILAAFSGAGGKWKKVKTVALRGFVKCSDGRLYHKVLCEEVLRAAQLKRDRRDRTAKATEARKKGRDDQRDDMFCDNRDDQRDVDRNVHQEKGREEEEKKNPNPPPSVSPSGRGGAKVLDSPKPPPPDPAAATLRQGIVAVFADAGSPNIPDTSRAVVWISQGLDPALCLAVISEAVKKRPDINNLSYFEPAIRRAHEARLPQPPPAATCPRVSLPGGCNWPVASVEEAIRKWQIDPRSWMGTVLGDPPRSGHEYREIREIAARVLPETAKELVG